MSTHTTPESAQTALIREDKEPPKVMTKSVFTLRLSYSVAQEMKPQIESIIPATDRSFREKIKTRDSPIAGGSVAHAASAISCIFEFLQNKDVCYTVAAIVIAWIRSKNGKQISIKKDGYKIDAKGLTEQELFRLLSETKSKISIEEKD